MSGEMASVGFSGRGSGNGTAARGSGSLLQAVDNANSSRASAVGADKQRSYDKNLVAWTTSLDFAGGDVDTIMDRYKTDPYYRKNIDRNLAAINEVDSQRTVSVLSDSRRNDIDKMKNVFSNELQNGSTERVASLVAMSCYKLQQSGRQSRSLPADEFQSKYMDDKGANTMANVVTAFYELPSEQQVKVLNAMGTIDAKGNKLSEEQMLSTPSALNYFNESSSSQAGNVRDYAREIISQDTVEKPTISKIDETAVDKYIQEMQIYGQDMTREEASQKLMDAQSKVSSVVERLNEEGFVKSGVVKTENGAMYQYTAKNPDVQADIAVYNRVLQDKTIRTPEQVDSLRKSYNTSFQPGSSACLGKNVGYGKDMGVISYGDIQPAMG